MAAIDLETATNRLVGDASLTSDVRDEEALTLLKWGQAQLPQLIDQHTRRDEFEDAFKQMRRFIKGVSKFIGEREYMAEAEKRDLLGKIAKVAAALDHPVSSQQIDDTTAALHGKDNITAIRILLSWVEPQENQPAQRRKSVSPQTVRIAPGSKHRFTTYAFHKKR